MSIGTGETLGLVGQAHAERTLLHAWRSGRLHHAWLLTGAAGIGKATLACRFAQALLGAPVGGDNQSSGSFAAHPDFLVVSRAVDERRQHLAAEITLEDVRAAHAFLRRTAAKGGWRVVVVDGADHLNRNAANALLKLIEEPPRQALVLLVCEAPGRVLPTIRSRCRTLRLGPLDDASMDSLLARLLPGLSQSERDSLVPLSHGSPGRAARLAAEQGIGLSSLVEDLLSRRERSGALWAYAMADTVLAHENGFATFLSLLSDAISSLAADAARGLPDDRLGQDRVGHNRRGQGATRSRDIHQWTSVCTELARLRDETERLNLDKRHAVLACLSLLSG